MPTLDQVNAFLNTTKDAREYKRAMAVKLLLLEFEPRDIAELLQVTASFVSKWKKLCFEHGVAVFVIKYHGYQGYLTSEQRQSITERIKTQHIANIDDLVVSSGFRGLPAIVFGVITNDDQVKDDQATQVIRKAANFIGFGAKLAEEAFQQVG